jgi:arylsulfatase A-like enzyme
MVGRRIFTALFLPLYAAGVGFGYALASDSQDRTIAAGAIGLIAAMAIAWLAHRYIRPFAVLGGLIVFVWIIAVCGALAIGYRAAYPHFDVWLAARSVAGTEKESDDRTNVLFVMLDTLRTDYLSCYGYPQRSSPNIDAFAAEGTRFLNVMSPGRWTLPSHASIFTGLSVSQHGVSWSRLHLPDECVTLAEALRDTGYQTAAFSSNVIFDNKNFDQGFDSWETIHWQRLTKAKSPLKNSTLDWFQKHTIRSTNVQAGLGILPSIEGDKGAVDLTIQLMRWFRNDYDPERPFFLFLNYFETHMPFEPPHRFRTETLPDHLVKESYEWKVDYRLVCRFNTSRIELSPAQLDLLKKLYEAEVRYLDAQLRHLFNFLRQAKLLDNTLVVITSDHGEYLGEHHRIEHMDGVYEPLVNVPLIIRYPGLFPSGQTVENLVQTSDLFGTVLRICGVDFDPGESVTWRDLTQWTAPEKWARRAVAEQLDNKNAHYCLPEDERNLEDTRAIVRAIRSGPWKFIVGEPDGDRLYNINSDPLETTNLLDQRPRMASDLRKQIGEWVEATLDSRIRDDGAGVSAEPSEEASELLRDLGYME